MSKPCIAIGGILHESNTFCAAPTGLEQFSVWMGNAIQERYTAAHHEVSGFLAGAAAEGLEVHPAMVANATPSGTVTAQAFESLAGRLLETLAAGPRLDGVLLALHGAMVSESYPDADGEIVRRVRARFGAGTPIVVTHDHHANVSEAVVAESTALVIYKTNPHLDQRERGIQAAQILAQTVRGEAHPVQALAKPPMFLNIVHQKTALPPLLGPMQAARALEGEPRVLAASIASGYQYADVAEMGPAAVVVTDGDRALAEAGARRLGQMLLDMRPQLTFTLPGVAEAVRLARASAEVPVVLVDMGDNIGAGSAADSTFLLAELLAQGAEGWVVVLADPASARECAQAGAGAPVALLAGGKTDNLHGRPVPINGRVMRIHDGHYEEPDPRHGGERFHDQGLTAVVEVDGARGPVRNLLVVTSLREPPFSLHQILSLGIEPRAQRILVVKAAVAYRAAYEPIAGRIIEVDSPGVTAVNPARFIYRRVRRPLWGLDPAPPERSEQI